MVWKEEGKRGGVMGWVEDMRFRGWKKVEEELRGVEFWEGVGCEIMGEGVEKGEWLYRVRGV